MGRVVRIPFFGLLLVLLNLGQAANAAKSGEAGTKGAPLVQLAPFMAPVLKSNGRITATPVTPVLRLASAHVTEEVCWLTPRILDAFVNVLHREPIPGSKHGGLDLVTMRKTLTDAINSALGRPLVSGLDLVPWARSAETGGTVSGNADTVTCDF